MKLFSIFRARDTDNTAMPHVIIVAHKKNDFEIQNFEFVLKSSF